MDIFTTEVKKYTKKTDFNQITVRLTPTQTDSFVKTIFHLLDTKINVVDTHYVPNVGYIACNGEGCTFCENNKAIYKRSPKTFRNEVGYFGNSTKYLMNVYETTPVIICPKCGNYYKNLNIRECSCSQSLIGIQPVPLNRNLILRVGKRVFEAIQSFLRDPSTKIDDADDYKKIIEKFGGKMPPVSAWIMKIEVSATDKTKQDFSVNPNPDKVTPFEYSEQLRDLNDGGYLVLSNSEMLEISHGVSLKDIFNARKVKEEITDVDDDNTIKNAAEELFG